MAHVGGTEAAAMPILMILGCDACTRKLMHRLQQRLMEIRLVPRMEKALTIKQSGKVPIWPSGTLVVILWSLAAMRNGVASLERNG